MSALCPSLALALSFVRPRLTLAGLGALADYHEENAHPSAMFYRSLFLALSVCEEKLRKEILSSMNRHTTPVSYYREELSGEGSMGRELMAFRLGLTTEWMVHQKGAILARRGERAKLLSLFNELGILEEGPNYGETLPNLIKRAIRAKDRAEVFSIHKNGPCYDEIGAYNPELLGIVMRRYPSAEWRTGDRFTAVWDKGVMVAFLPGPGC